MDQNAKGVRNAYLTMLFDGLCVSSASVILPLLKEHHNLSYNLSGLLLALLSVGNLASALICGFLPRRWGVRRTMLLFTSGLFLGYLLLAVSGSPALLLLSFLLIGLGKGSTMNNATVITGAAAKDRTKSVNLINALFAIGSLSAPFLYLACSGRLFWQSPIVLLSVSGGIVWLLFFFIKRNDPQQAKPQKDDLSFLRDKHFWFSTAFLFCQQCAEISVTGWLVTYFKDQGILSGVFSEFTVTVIWFAMLVGRLIIAFVLPQNSRLRSLVLMSACAIVTYALLLTATSGIMAIITLFLFGFSMSGTYPTSIAQANKSLSNASVGVLLPVAGIGAVVMPYITGAVAQHIGIQGGMACSLVALCVMLLFALLLRRGSGAAAPQ